MLTVCLFVQMLFETAMSFGDIPIAMKLHETIERSKHSLGDHTQFVLDRLYAFRLFFLDFFDVLIVLFPKYFDVF